MSVIINGTIKLYHFLNEDLADPRTQEWFLMKSPWAGLAILAVYLMAVLRWLPNYMKDRPPYDLRGVIIVFNTIQIAGCSYIFYKSLTLGWLNDYSLVCQPVDFGPQGVEYAWTVCYGYFILKLLDLLDTIFFVLRKKQSQVSFLHLYHHFGMTMLSWAVVKWLPGGHGTLLIMINSLVHIIMYSYYLLTAWDSKYKQSVWWKKHVTQIQIIQFTIILAHFIALAVSPDCAYPRLPAYLLIPHNLFIVLLFSDFYYRAYIKPKTD